MQNAQCGVGCGTQPVRRLCRPHDAFGIAAAWQAVRGDAQVTEELHVLRGNIRVLCRVRPLADSAAVPALEFPRQGAIVVQDKRPHAYEFDAVFSPAVDQARCTSSQFCCQYVHSSLTSHDVSTGIACSH